MNTKKLLVVLECLKDRAFDSAECLRSCFLHYPLMVLSHIFTGCSQGGKVTFGDTLCTPVADPGGGGGGGDRGDHPPPPYRINLVAKVAYATGPALSRAPRFLFFFAWLVDFFPRAPH